MSSSYIKNFKPNADRKEILEVINDFVQGNALQHFKKRYVSDKTKSQDGLADWAKIYTTSNYMNHIITDYVEYVSVLKELNPRIIKNSKGNIDEKKNKLLNKFYKLNNWNSTFKMCASNRKQNGDVYIYWYLIEDSDGSFIPKLKFLDSKYMSIKADSDGIIFAYVYEREVEYDVKSSIKGEFETKTKNVKWIFEEGGVFIYEDDAFVKEIPNKVELSNIIPIIHLQFMKETDSPYSVVPAESFIDLCLRLDRSETTIALTNALQGSPQLIITDGQVDMENSAFGANAILYVDSTLYDISNGVSKQAKVQQLEITNELKSLENERISVLETLYDRANLISPDLYKKLATTDSSKVWDSARKNLEEEIKNFYEEMIDKFEIIFTKLFELNEIKIDKNAGSITLKMPDYIIEKNIFDKYLLKAQKMGIGELTMRENLRNEGYTDKEIDKKFKELNEEYMEKNKDISIAKSNNQIENVEKINVDNNLKKV